MTVERDDREYQVLLQEFASDCEALVDRGLPYLAVILCHELYRFLYPVEPYAGFKHEDPVPFATAHIRKLIDLSNKYATSVAAYPPYPTARRDPAADAALERSTSDLYSELWKDFDTHTLTEESLTLLTRRLPDNIIQQWIRGKTVLDMGCGSGRYSIALSRVGAAEVTAVDVQQKSFATARDYCRQEGLRVSFQEANVLDLRFEPASFDFVFSNGVLHHTASLARGLAELARVLRPSGRAFLYLYGAGGVYWSTRAVLRRVFRKIPLAYTKAVLTVIGMPSNRFIFCDTWYVPIEGHTTLAELEDLLTASGLIGEKIVGRNAFDLDGALEAPLPGARAMWGDGEHRYLLRKA